MIEVISLTKNLLSYLLFGQELPEPFRTMLEVMVQFMKNRDVQSGSTSVGMDKSSQKSKQQGINYNCKIELFVQQMNN